MLSMGKTSLNYEDQIINEKEGMFIFFPSWLFHGVNVCKSDRTTVAFNFVKN